MVKKTIACLIAALAVACASRTARVGTAASTEATAAGAGAARASRAVTYTQVQSILRNSCEHCHNEDKTKGGLLLDSYEALLAGGENGKVIVPGQSGSSRLVQPS